MAQIPVRIFPRIQVNKRNTRPRGNLITVKVSKPGLPISKTVSKRPIIKTRLQAKADAPPALHTELNLSNSPNVQRYPLSFLLSNVRSLLSKVITKLDLALSMYPNAGIIQYLQLLDIIS